MVLQHPTLELLHKDVELLESICEKESPLLLDYTPYQLETHILTLLHLKRLSLALHDSLKYGECDDFILDCQVNQSHQEIHSLRIPKIWVMLSIC